MDVSYFKPGKLEDRKKKIYKIEKRNKEKKKFFYRKKFNLQLILHVNI